MFTVKLDVATGLFDDSALAEFFAMHDALDASEHWLSHDGVPTLAVLVRYRDVAVGEKAARGRIVSAKDDGERVDPAADLEPGHRALFETLRKWRNDRAKRDGRPAYVLFTNTQLVELVRTRPETKAALGALDGFGEARLRDYGDDILALVAASGDTGG